MNQIVVLGGSAAVIALMLLIAALLGFWQTARIDAVALERLLADAEPDARIAESAIADDGRVALARLSDARVLIAKAMGDRIALRTYPSPAVTLRLRDRRLRAAFADLGFPTLNMKLSDPPRWLVDWAASGGEKP